MHQQINGFPAQFQDAERQPPEDENGAMFTPLGRFGITFWRPLDFEGSFRLMFLDMSGAVASSRTNNTCLINIPLKLENVKQRKA